MLQTSGPSGTQLDLANPKKSKFQNFIVPKTNFFSNKFQHQDSSETLWIEINPCELFSFKDSKNFIQDLNYHQLSIVFFLFRGAAIQIFGRQASVTFSDLDQRVATVGCVFHKGLVS